jgi:2-polyprenyl-3-methyl-5-hydroxy-6-metoxy-1,4-benzoquinol methylase
MLTVHKIGGLRRTLCPGCHHSQRLDLPEYDYKTIAMGSTGVAIERLHDQAAFLSPYLREDNVVLEIGCAAGNLAKVLMARHRFHRYDGIEPSPAGNQAKAILHRLFSEPLIDLMSEGSIKEGEYDFLISSHCLEHLRRPQEEIAAMKKAVSPQGLIFIEVPNGSGNRLLPFDDNRSHLHFFSVSSLTRLLVNHGLQICAVQTGAKLDARYSDSIRILARCTPATFTIDKKYLSDHPRLADENKVVVWGAGKMVEELLSHFFDRSRIAFFVDSDRSKHGSSCMDLPVRPIETLLETPGSVVLINSLEFEESIRRAIAEQFCGTVKRVISISELLT